MSSEEPFRFKQFTVWHDKCAMKVNTDGVLLGAWADSSQATHILDIGTGTGLIALMLAQRNALALIDAVEIEHNAYQQAVFNFAQSPWATRLQAYLTSVQQWATETPAQYDLIVSNPPFFEIGKHSITTQQNRQTARYTGSLSHETLLHSAYHLLSEEGIFSVILPSQQGQSFIEQATTKNNFFLHRLAQIAPREGKLPTRWLIELRKTPVPQTACNQWAIRCLGSGYHDYTAVYIALTRDFYLFMD
jgi:tRNA1Val (adenine37-N6)-methyltransferase